MKPERAGPVEVAPDLWQLTLPILRHSLGGANAFLIRDRDGYALVDCGADVVECWDALARQLADLQVPFGALHTIVLTHWHPDHSGQANRVREQSQAHVLLHQSDAAYLGCADLGDVARRRQLAAWLARYGFPEEEIVALVEAVSAPDRRAEAIRPDRVVAGGEVLALGRYRLEVLWTPGHTPGHICLYDPRQRVLLCGDHILEVVAPNVGLHPFTDGNPLPAYLDSLHDLASRDIALTLPGHGQPIIRLADTTAELVRRQRDRRAQVLSLLTAAPQSAYELASQVWAQRGRRNWNQLHGQLRRNAVGTVAAHLELLAEGGDIARSEDGVVTFRRRG
ncbi:MAG: MBL fold metallo-hydrolase [Chloroflexota bacterium]|nr:MBL fold metallo-hydrolase [Chloroflexota bacterium]